MRLSTLQLLAILGLLQVPVFADNFTCSSTAFTAPNLHSIEVQKILAKEVIRYSLYSLTAEGATTGLDFCNVTVTYTHPGWNDSINVHIWLPLNDWNGRFMGLGGGGFSAGFPDGPQVANAVEKGYAAATTDAGHTTDSPWDVESWALSSPGNPNLPLLYDFSFVALNDLSIIGKDITNQYYSQSPKYSYWNGCSTGGRQGLALAQRFPEAFDGILAIAPAINWARFLMAEFWPYLVMKQIGTFPPQCEFAAITTAAVKACDEKDGLLDGIIGAPDLCHFDAESVVGQSFDCHGIPMSISPEAVKAVKAAWEGPVDPSGKAMWYGVSPGTNLAALLSTICTAEGVCTGSPFPAPAHWIKYWLKADPSFDPTSITLEEYYHLFHASVQGWDSLMSFNDPNLSALKASGHRMITWHGLDDEVIPPNGTRQYYDNVLTVDPDAGNYYRYFEVPGVGHCRGGPGPFPYDALDVLVDWVENDIVPDRLSGRSPPISNDGEGKAREQPLCPYPLVSAYQGVGDPSDSTSFACMEGYGTEHDEQASHTGKDEL